MGKGEGDRGFHAFSARRLGAGSRRPSRAPARLGVLWAIGVSLVGGCGLLLPYDEPEFENPMIPWLAEGEPPVAEPDIPWLPRGDPPVEPPDIPWLGDGVPPIEWPCTHGWQRVRTEGVWTCEPYATGGPEECADGDVRFPGEDRCGPIGRACGDDPFPPVGDVDDDTVVLHVLRDAEPGGDGTRDAPFSTLAAALDQARDGAEVVLGPGDYAVDRFWPDGVSLRGRCARDTALVAAAAADLPAVLRIGGASSVRDVRIGSGETAGLIVSGPAARVSMEGVRVGGVSDHGLRVIRGARLEARRVAIEQSAVGVSVEAGSTASFEGLFGRGLGVGIDVVGPDAGVDVTSVAIVDSVNAAVRGVDGARVSLQRASFTSWTGDANAAGISASGELTQVVVQDAVIRGLAWGLVSTRGAQAEVARGLFDGTERPVVADGAHVGLSDTLVIGAGMGTEEGDVAVRVGPVPLPPRAGLPPGFQPSEATARLARVMVSPGRGTAIYVAGRSSLTIEDAVIRDIERGSTGSGRPGPGRVGYGGVHDVVAGAPETPGSVSLPGEAGCFDCGCPECDRWPGVGLVVFDDASAALSRTVFDRNREVAVVVEDGGAIRGEQVTLRGGSCAAAGSGLRVGAATAELARVDVEDMCGYGVRSEDGSTVVLTDATLRGASSDDGSPGVGLDVRTGGSLSLVRGRLTAHATAAAIAAFTGSSIDLRDTVVRGADDDSVVGGRGLLSTDGAALVLERVLVERTGDVGVLVQGGASLDLDDAVIRDTYRDTSLAAALESSGGRGLDVRSAVAVVDRALISRSGDAGVRARGAFSSVRLRDVGIRAARLDPRHPIGRGLEIEAGAAAIVENAIVETHAGFAVRAAGADTDLTLRDVAVRDTSAPGCELDSCGEGEVFGAGVVSLEGASVAATRAVIDANDACGLVLFAGSDLDVTDAVVSGHGAGLCLDVAGFDISRVQTRVRYADNVLPVELLQLP